MTSSVCVPLIGQVLCAWLSLSGRLREPVRKVELVRSYLLRLARTLACMFLCESDSSIEYGFILAVLVLFWEEELSHSVVGQSQ